MIFININNNFNSLNNSFQSINKVQIYFELEYLFILMVLSVFAYNQVMAALLLIEVSVEHESPIVHTFKFIDQDIVLIFLEIQKVN